MTTTNKPIKTFKQGRVSASIWENMSEDGEAYYITKFERSYQDEQGNWRYSHSYSLSNLFSLMSLMAKVASYISYKNLSETKLEHDDLELLGEPEDY